MVEIKPEERDLLIATARAAEHAVHELRAWIAILLVRGLTPDELDKLRVLMQRVRKI